MREGEPSHSVLLERAGVIAQMARACAEETNRERRVPKAVVDELSKAGLMDISRPKHWGGLERSYFELYELAYTLAQGCGSTGWVYCVLAGHSAFVGTFPMEAQEEVWGRDTSVLISSSLVPRGQMTPVAGGFRLTGHFPFSSGCDYAQWALVGAMGPGPNGQPLPHICLVPISELAIVDDWHTLGLCGTGSKTLVGKDVFVPARRVTPFPTVASIALFSIQSAVVGAAVGGVNAFIDEIRDKPGKAGAPPPAQSDHYQSLIGQSWADLTAAWTLLKDAMRRTEGIGEEPRELVIANMATNAVITRLTVRAIERVYELSGGHGVYNGAISRALRDVRAGGQHISTNAAIATKEVGAFLLAPSA